MKEGDPLDVILSAVDADGVDNIELKRLKNDKRLLNATLKCAQRNGLLYLFTRNINHLNLDLTLFENVESKKELKNTINVLNNASKECDILYILIKDCNTVPHIPRDVDIFVRAEEKESLIEALAKQGVRCEHSGDIETTLTAESCLPIDLYTKIIYFDNEFLDEDFLFDSIEEKEMFGIRYPGLNNEAEFMLTLLHSLFGHRRLTLLDFLHLKRIQDSKLNVELCEKYAETAKWGSVFLLAWEKSNLICKEVYIKKNNIMFPYLFDIKFVMKCIQQINGIDLSQSDKLLIYFSLLLDGAKLKLEGSMFYNIVRGCTPLRKVLLSIGYRSRSMRGDKYS